jgi:hypothetical protein
MTPELAVADVPLDEYVLTDPNLPLKGKGLFALIAAMEAKSGEPVAMALDALCRLSRDSRDATAAAVAALEKAGYLIRDRVQRRGRAARTIWRLNDPRVTPQEDAA